MNLPSIEKFKNELSNIQEQKSEVQRSLFESMGELWKLEKSLEDFIYLFENHPEELNDSDYIQIGANLLGANEQSMISATAFEELAKCFACAERDLFEEAS